MYFVNLNILRCNFIKKDVIPNILLTLAFFYHRTGSSLCLERDTQAAKSHLNCPEMSLILTIFKHRSPW